MKKMLNLLLIISMCTLTFCIFLQKNTDTGNRFLYGKYIFMLKSVKPKVQQDQFIAFLYRLSNEHHINISHYSYIDDQRIFTYHTNLPTDPYVSVSPQKKQLLNRGDYLSNERKENKERTLFLPIPNIKMRFYDFNQLKNVSPLNSLFVDEQGAAVLKQHLGKYVDFSIKKPSSVIAMNLTAPLFMGSLALLTVLLALQFFYLYQRRTEYHLYPLWGYSRLRCVLLPLKKLPVWLGIGSGIGLLGCSCFNLLHHMTLSYQLNSVLLFLVPVFLLSFLLACLFGAFYVSAKEQLLKKMLFTLSLGAKYVTCGLVVLFLLFSLVYRIELKGILGRMDYWGKTKNIYKTMVSANQTNNSFAEDDKQAQALEKLYPYLTEQKAGFILDTANFSVTPDAHGNLKYEYMLHPPESEAEKYANIEVIASPNYFTYNPIQDEHNQPVQRAFQSEANTLNLIVPASLKEQEVAIKKSYLNGFYFQKVEVANMLAKKLNRPQTKIAKQDLKVNVIYAQTGAKYFTFDSQTGSPKTNQITDPIVTIYELYKIGPSSLVSYASRCLFFYDTHPGKTYEHLLPVLQRTGNANAITATPSVYNELGMRIQKFKAELNKATLNVLVVGAVSVLFLLTLLYFICQIKHRQLYVKSLFGYSFGRLFTKEFLYLSVPTLVIGLLIYLQNPITALLTSVLFYTLLDLTCIYLFLQGMLKANLKEALQLERG